MLRLLLTISFMLFTSTSYASIGNVVEHRGVASVERSGEKSVLKKGSDVEFKDNVRTGDGDVGIKFVDETNVAVSPHSSLIIDEFIYDPNSRSGSKLVMNIALGTVRYASGNIAKLNRQNVDIRTPTARIGVRGTAFSMTVDEIGKSLVILLPNADGTVGEIEVESDAGLVILNQAFQATTVGVSEGKPSKPVLLDLTLDQINNLKNIQDETSIKGSSDIFSISDNINTLIDQCVEFGTIPFSVIARHGFIAECLLRSAENNNAISSKTSNT